MKISQEKFNEIFFSFIWGFGLAIMFRKICKNGKCVVIKIPPKNLIENKVFLDYETGKCYKFVRRQVKCED